MQLNISGHHVHVTSAIENYLIRKLEKIERHNESIVNGQVILSVNRTDNMPRAGFIVPGWISLRSQPIEIFMPRLMR